MEGVLHSLSICELRVSICHLIANTTLFNPAKLFNVGPRCFQPRKFWEHRHDCISVAKYRIPLSSSVVSYYRAWRAK